MPNQKFKHVELTDPFSPRELRLSLSIAVVSVASAVGVVGLLPLRMFGL